MSDPDRSDQIDPSFSKPTPAPSSRAQKSVCPRSLTRGLSKEANVAPGTPGAGSPESMSVLYVTPAWPIAAGAIRPTAIGISVNPVMRATSLLLE